MSDHHHYKPRDFHFAQPLVTLRRRAGLTQEAVALHIGVTEKAISNWESGSYYPSEANLRKLLELYLDKDAFAAGQEQDEARALWDQLRASSHRRTSSFDELWFAGVLKQWMAHRIGLAPPEDFRPTPAPTAARLPQADWGAALDVSSVYGRSEELAELEQWLLSKQCRLVALLGMGGIGKTTLAVKLVGQVASHFDCVLWRSLHNAPALEDVLRDWLQVLSPQRSPGLPQNLEHLLALLLEQLQARRCLLVLDNLETLLQVGVLQGGYRPGYEGYGTLLQRLAQTSHQSCLLLTCRELVSELAVASGREAPVRLLRLAGLSWSAGQQLLADKGLFGSEAAWAELVQRYAGNPLALKIVAETVRELFGGDITAFLAEGLLTFHSIRQLLDQQFARLSPLEQTLISWLAIARELIGLEALRQQLWPAVSKGEVVEALHALRYRSLVERGEPGAVFTLQPVVLEYVSERLVSLVSQEILDSRPALLLTHALLQGQAKEYVRASQARLVLQPLFERLVARLGSREAVEHRLEGLLGELRALPRAEQGYGGGNVVNLLVGLNGQVRGKDCSGLAIWQADLQATEAQDANFAGCDLTGAVFMETISIILSVALSADGQYVAAGSNSGEIHLWHVMDGQPLLTIVGHAMHVWTLAFDPEGTRLVSGGYDGLVKVWEVSSGQCLRTLEGHTRWVRSLAMHPDGRRLATCSDDRSIRLWDLTTGSCLRVWPEQDHEVWSVAFSPDGSLLASGSAAGLVTVWDLSGEQCLWRSAAHGGTPASSLAFSPDSELLASAGHDARIQLWEVSSGAQLGALSGHTDVIQSVAFTAEGLLVSGGFDRSVKLWQIGPRGEAGPCVGTLQGYSGWVWGLACGPAGLLASGSHDGSVKLWQINRGGEGGKCLRTLQGYSRSASPVSFSPDGRILVSVEHNGTVRMWETQSGRYLHVLSRQASEAIAFRPDGRIFAYSSPANEINIWDIEHGQYLRTLQEHQGEIWSLVFSSDGRFLLSCSLDTTIKRWEVESGDCLATLQGHRSWVWALASSPDERLLASGDVNGAVKLWDIERGQCLRTLQGSPRAIVALTFTPDGTTLLSSNEQDLVTAWDVQSGERLKSMPGIGDTYWLGSVAFSADGSLLAATSRDQTIKLWDVSRGELRQTLPCPASRPWSVAFSADQRLLASGMDDGTILLWEWQKGQCLLTLRSDRPYERMNISGVTGITEAQRASLKALGAIEEED